MQFLRSLLLFFFFAQLASAFAITGGGNFTNFSNVTGDAINITGAGYYYFVRSNTAATTVGHINYTHSDVDAAVSIETSNVVVDCQYPSLPRSIIAAALSPANTAAGVVVNATRTLNHLQNITIRNCLFTNYSRTSTNFDNAGIIISGNVTGLTIYNNTFNDSAIGIMLTTNGSSNVAVGIFSAINISTNTFFNISTGTGSVVEMRSHPIPTVRPNNPLSIRDSIVEYNNFTWDDHGVVNYSNATNLTVFGNLVYNGGNGFNFVNVNASNISNNNITALFHGNTLYGIRIDNISQSDIASAPNLFANNWIYNTTAGFFGGGLRIEASYSNISRNTVIDSMYGIISSDLDRTDAFASHLIITDNYFRGVNISAIYIYNSTNASILRNTITSSFMGASPFTTAAGIAFLGSNGSVSIGNVMSNVDVGFAMDNSVNNTSQDDVLGNTNNMSIYLVNRANFSAVNLSANLSNVSSSGLGPFNLTVQYPMSVSVVDLAGALLSGAAFSISANSALPAGWGGVVASGTGSGSFNLTTFVAFLSSHTLTTYNYTPHSSSASLAGYQTATGSAILPVGTSGSVYNYVLTLTPNPHSSSDSSSSSTPPAPVVEPVTPPAHEPEVPSTDSNPSSQPNGHSSSVDDVRRDNSTASGGVNVGTQSGSVSLNLPVVGNVQVDPLVAVAVLVVVVLIVLILMGMM